ncbi:unnamed protein product, partial [Staurois parvus]
MRGPGRADTVNAGAWERSSITNTGGRNGGFTNTSTTKKLGYRSATRRGEGGEGTGRGERRGDTMAGESGEGTGRGEGERPGRAERGTAGESG